MIGFIYIMSNPAHPDIQKIGQTAKDPEERRKELGSTGVLEDFVLEYRALSEDYESLEREIHRSLSHLRHRQEREFFRISVPEAIHIIKEIAGDRIESEKVYYVSPEELLKIEEKKKKKEEEVRKAGEVLERRWKKEQKERELIAKAEAEKKAQLKRLKEEEDARIEALKEEERIKIETEKENERLERYNKVYKPPKNILLLPFWVVWFPFSWFWYITDDKSSNLPVLIMLLAYFVVSIYFLIFIFLFIMLPIQYFFNLVGIE